MGASFNQAPPISQKRRSCGYVGNVDAKSAPQWTSPWKEGRKEGRKAGRTEGRKEEGRKEGTYLVDNTTMYNTYL